MSLRLISAFYFFGIALAGSVVASDAQPEKAGSAVSPIVIIGPYVPSLLDVEKPGPYNQLYAMIFDNAAFEIDFRIMPINRAHKVFTSGVADCLFLGVAQPDYYAASGVSDVLISTVMNRLYLKAYTRAGEVVVEKRGDLENKILAGERGVLQNFIDYTGKPDGAQLVSVETNEMAFTLLRQKRVDMVIAFTLDAAFFFASHGHEQYNSSEKYVVFENTEAITCHPTAAGRLVIDHVNPIINRLISDGTIEQLFAPPD